MNKPTTAKKLSEVLKQGRNTCMNALGLEGIAIDELEALAKMCAYHDFRGLIQKYQVHHQISGIVWRAIELAEHDVVVFPDVDDQLECLDTDLEILRQHKSAVLDAWKRHVEGEDFSFWYEDFAKGQTATTCLVDNKDILRLANNAEWAMIYAWDSEPGIVLQVGWGNPIWAGYYNHPESGNFWFHSVPSTYWNDECDGWIPDSACPIRF